ncbi:thermonuclease family protein [Senegalia massiliensis]|uniref:TNase-like domain-containing protein n=1 Tax=Senegalia massiliensis TaxID=1720316 RepID=A0A845R0S0_9CLOT|nr:thermonuclease family protein [Senegalia massiliensis]NBI08171.1 hypothetical protein [Senegalia massiliensis]
MNNFLSYVPGFRSDTTWKKIVAVLYYLFSILIIFEALDFFLFLIASPFVVFGFINLIKNRKNIKTNPRFILSFIIPFIVLIVGFAMPTDSQENEKQLAIEQQKEDEQKAKEEAKLEQEKKEKARKEEEKRLEEERKAEFEKGFISAKVTKHVDGDTVHVTTEDGEELKIRMIGVDTPETVHPSKPVEFYGKEASLFTEEKIFEETVYLEKDVSDNDKYGRALRYIWLEVPEEKDLNNKEVIKDKLFNAMLIAKGYANSSTYQPDVKYQEIFTELEKESREANLGLWDSAKLEEFERQKEQARKEEQAKKEQQAAEEKKKQEAAKSQQSSSSSSSSSQSASASAPAQPKQETAAPAEPNVQTVLVTPTGSKYHRQACGRGTYTEATLQSAKSRGLTPCKKCY